MSLPTQYVYIQSLPNLNTKIEASQKHQCETYCEEETNTK